MTPDTKMRQELLPCPFCGAGAWLEEYQERAGVRCEDCCNRTALHFTVEEAIAAWNRRSTHTGAGALPDDMATSAKPESSPGA